MALPALIFMMFNAGSEGASGWGIPMATDIAFSLGVASLLGERVPLSLKIFLTALAIIDDLGAIIAIAVFYTTSLKLKYLVGGLILFGLQALWVKFKQPFGWWNILAGLLLWFLIFNSGIHATIAGVLFAFTIPSTQLVKWENKLHHSVNFLIIPFFVLFNTAILIPSSFVDDLGSPLSLGIISGLIIGKPLGIVHFCWLTVKLKWGELSGSISWKQLGGLGILASIGFTMSIFISLLAFNELGLQNLSKTAVMTASIMAILFSFIWFKWIVNPKGQLKEKALNI
jgi:NhaA family Na+:H+ antiporter